MVDWHTELGWEEYICNTSCFFPSPEQAFSARLEKAISVYGYVSPHEALERLDSCFFCSECCAFAFSIFLCLGYVRTGLGPRFLLCNADGSMQAMCIALSSPRRETTQSIMTGRQKERD